MKVNSKLKQSQFDSLQNESRSRVVLHVLQDEHLLSDQDRQQMKSSEAGLG